MSQGGDSRVKRGQMGISCARVLLSFLWAFHLEEGSVAADGRLSRPLSWMV